MRLLSFKYVVILDILTVLPACQWKCVFIRAFNFDVNLPVVHTSRLREMLHSGSAIRQPLQHPFTPSLLLEHALQLRAETARSEALPSPPAGPHSAASRRPRRRGPGRRGALRTARSGVGLLPGLFLSGSSDLQQAARRRLLCGCKTEHQ